MNDLLTVIVALAPLGAAMFVWIRKHEPLVLAVDRVDAAIASHLHHCQDAEEFLARYVVRPLLSPLKAIGDATASIEDAYLKSAVRLVAWGYFALAIAWLVSLLPYVLIALVVVVLFLAAVQNLMNGSGGSRPIYYGSDPKDDAPPPATPAPRAPEDEPGR